MTPATLRERRHLEGLTQVELAEQLGVSVRTIRNWESGRSPIPRTAALALDSLMIGRPLD